ncbi:MAG: 23S rRNA (guanosine(2251)-2'-O)-methyltransferase RlmB [bacterium]
MANEDLVYGPHSVADALDANRVKRIWVLDTPDKGKAAQAREQLAQRASKAGITVERVPRSYLDSRMGRSNHQGIIAKVTPFTYAELDELISNHSGNSNFLIVIADGIQDPGNLGHVLRIAAGFKADGVIIPEHRAVDVTPTVEKTAAGNAGKIPVVKVNNLTRAVKMLQEEGIWIYAADTKGTQSLPDVKFANRMAWVVGGEHEGVSRLLLESCDEVISIPMPGEIESFNVATSVAVGLYEYRRQYPGK